MFEFRNRKKESALLLIPGWAFDSGIFDTLDLPYNYILTPKSESIFNFGENLKKYLKKMGIGRVSILGWSQGGTLACDFACKNPDVIDELILVSVKEKHEKVDLENIKNYLKKNRKAYLYSFYKECFASGEKTSFSWFRKRFLKDYLENTELEGLLKGLDRLREARIDAGLLKKVKKIKIAHGKKDKIVAFREALKLSNKIPHSKLVIFEDTGHLPFLKENFKEVLFNG